MGLRELCKAEAKFKAGTKGIDNSMHDVHVTTKVDYRLQLIVGYLFLSDNE